MKTTTPAKFEIVTDSLTSPSTALDPQATIQDINALHASSMAQAEQARALCDAAASKAIVMGLKLTALKEATPHGQWESLFSSGQRRVGKSNGQHVGHLLDITISTAKNRMAVAANFMSKRLSPEQRAALTQIATRPGDTDLSPAEARFLDELVPEKSLRQLCISMGIVKPTRMEQRHLDDDSASRAPEKPKRQLSLAEQQLHLRDCARRDWFGTERPGLIEDGSFLSILRTHMDHPETSSLHHLERQDLDILIADFKRFLKFANQF